MRSPAGDFELFIKSMKSFLSLAFFFFLKKDKNVFGGFLYAAVSFLLPCCITTFKNYSAKQKLWHMQIHPVVPRVNDKLNRFHDFLRRNQRAHQLSNMLGVCATTAAPLEAQQTQRRFVPSRKAGSGPSSFVSMLRTWLSTQPLSRLQIKPFISNTLYPSVCS